MSAYGDGAARRPDEPLGHQTDERRRAPPWLRLLILHTPFRAADQAAYERLEDTLRELEKVFLSYSELQGYYIECFAPEDSARPDEGDLEHWRVAHMVMLQAQLMEDVYFVLQLVRYGNAPDNRGWMNLFRRWGRSPTFNASFDRLRATFASEFVRFYDLYLFGYEGTIDEQPIPHPWDPVERRVYKRRAAQPGPERAPATAVRALTPLPGVFLDSGVREAALPRWLSDSYEPPAPLPASGAHGIADAKGGDQSYEQPPQQAGPDGTQPGGRVNA